jgi:hypothetical protein
VDGGEDRLGRGTKAPTDPIPVDPDPTQVAAVRAPSTPPLPQSNAREPWPEPEAATPRPPQTASVAAANSAAWTRTSPTVGGAEGDRAASHGQEHVYGIILRAVMNQSVCCLGSPGMTLSDPLSIVVMGSLSCLPVRDTKVRAPAMSAPKKIQPDTTRKRSRLLQEDVPGLSLDQALRVPRAIADDFAYSPTKPLNVARSIGMTPTSGPFRALTGAAVAYGLTTGAAQAPEIGLTPIGMRIVRPTSEGDDVAAKRDALLRPRVVGEFLRRYDNAALPSDHIAKNVLQEMGVPSDRLDAVFALITEGAEAVGFLLDLKGKRYVDLTGSTPSAGSASPDTHEDVSGAPGFAVAGVSVPAIPSLQQSPTRAVSMSPGVHINIEIHIAADATSETVEEIFRNMRRYVLNDGTQPDDDSKTSV